MSMPIKDAIRRIRNHMDVHRIGQYPHILIGEAFNLAITALQEKAEREDPQPLTIEELRQLDEQPVWVKPEGAKAGYGMWCVVNHNRLTRRVEAFIPGIENTWFEGEEYEKTWLAYRHKPKEE